MFDLAIAVQVQEAGPCPILKRSLGYQMFGKLVIVIAQSIQANASVRSHRVLMAGRFDFGSERSIKTERIPAAEAPSMSSTG